MSDFMIRSLIMGWEMWLFLGQRGRPPVKEDMVFIERADTNLIRFHSFFFFNFKCHGSSENIKPWKVTRPDKVLHPAEQNRQL